MIRYIRVLGAVLGGLIGLALALAGALAPSRGLAASAAVSLPERALWESNRGTFEKPGLFEKDLVIEVTNQEGRRFWGNQTFTGKARARRSQ